MVADIIREAVMAERDACAAIAQAVADEFIVVEPCHSEKRYLIEMRRAVIIRVVKAIRSRK